MKRYLLLLIALMAIVLPAGAVLKEKNLDNTLSILRSELTTYQRELEALSGDMKVQREQVFSDLMTIMERSSQNSLMLYSQKPDYIFDLTYACHEATEQYARFQENVAPFRAFIRQNDYEITRYDSLIVNLSQMTTRQLSERAKVDRNVCLTLAVNIRRTLKDNTEQMQDYIRYYQMTEERLSHLNEYANERYREIQTSIFKNGGENYLTILRNLRNQLRTTKNAVEEKYYPSRKISSQWDANVIATMFIVIILSFILAYILNIGAIRIVSNRGWLPRAFVSKQKSLVMTTTVITIAFVLGFVRFVFKDQNFIIMASSLLVEYVWLLVVILISDRKSVV